MSLPPSVNSTSGLVMFTHHILLWIFCFPHTHFDLSHLTSIQRLCAIWRYNLHQILQSLCFLKPHTSHAYQTDALVLFHKGASSFKLYIYYCLYLEYDIAILMLLLQYMHSMDIFSMHRMTFYICWNVQWNDLMYCTIV